MADFIEIRNVEKSYLSVGRNFKGKRVKVLKGLSFKIEKGSCLGLIGESGSGKSTMSRLILGLEKPDKGHGEILFEGIPIEKWKRNNQGKVSVVFQDYTASINPYYTVKEAICEPISQVEKKFDLDKKTEEFLQKVGLKKELKNRYPHELSGGELQRVCIARAISTNPQFIVLDEAISSLDVTVQVQVLELLHQLQIKMNLTYLFVAHDLQAVAQLCNKILFLYQGEIVEEIKSSELATVKNPYAKALLASVIPFEV